jgi:hypothetical protein
VRRLVAGTVGLALLAAACGGGEPADGGPVSEAAAERALLGLCEILDATDRDAAEATFQDRTHQTLHDLATATEAVDRGAAADLLTSKQRVEADLAEPALPDGFGADVEVLLAATRAAFEVIGVEAPGCPA